MPRLGRQQASKAAPPQFATLLLLPSGIQADAIECHRTDHLLQMHHWLSSTAGLAAFHPTHRGCVAKIRHRIATGMEACVLLSVGRHSKQGSDEWHLTPDGSFLHALEVSLPHPIPRLVSLECSPCRCKREEALS